MKIRILFFVIAIMMAMSLADAALVNIGNGGINVDDGDNKVKIGSGGIVVDDEDDEVSIGGGGIEIEDEDDKVTIDSTGIEVDDDENELEDESDDDTIKISKGGVVSSGRNSVVISEDGFIKTGNGAIVIGKGSVDVEDGREYKIVINNNMIKIQQDQDKVTITDKGFVVRGDNVVIEDDQIKLGSVTIKSPSEVIVEDTDVKEIELKEENSKPVYIVAKSKKKRFLGIVSVTMDEEVRIDASSGVQISVKRPWWNFMAFG